MNDTAEALLRVLLVDDHAGFLDSAERFLKRMAGVRIVGRGGDGLEAVRLAEALKPDLVLMDLSMPGMGGLQATRLIKAQTAPPRVVIVSHYDDAAHREHAAQAGADGFVSKLAYVQEVTSLLQSETCP